MRLSCSRSDFEGLSESELRSAIKERREVIREHRDARGDDRCWMDDLLVWQLLSDTPETFTRLPDRQLLMLLCEQFYEHRREELPDPMSPDTVIDPEVWDDDLAAMDYDQLVDELERLQCAVRQHRSKRSSQNPLTTDHDRELYAVLPEKVPADFRLPPRGEFLGEAKAPNAGCPAFWESHLRCPAGEHNFHQWGPCSRRLIE